MDDDAAVAAATAHSGGSGQQTGAVAVAGDKWLWTSNLQLARMADGCVNRNMTNMRKFGFSEYACETRMKKINEIFLM